MEGSPNGHYHNVIECFDTKTKIWETLPIPGGEIRVSRSSAINGNLYLFGNLYQVGEKKTVVFKPKEKQWDVVRLEVRWSSDKYCVVDNVSYRYSGVQLEWWDSKVRALKGCERLRRYYYPVRLVNYGGKNAVFWEMMKKIWYAKVTIEKRNNGQEISGKVSRFGYVLPVPESSSFPTSSSFQDVVVSSV